jgi:hypothetical protein
MELTVAAKAVLLVLLGPVAALYDFATNPNAPPAIFTAQFTDAFGHPPGQRIEPLPTRPGKRVFVTKPL